MDDSDAIGFDARRPIGLWNQRLDIDGGGLFKAVLKGALGYFTGNALSAGIDGVFAIKTKPLKAEEQAWLLIQRSVSSRAPKSGPCMVKQLGLDAEALELDVIEYGAEAAEDLQPEDESEAP